MIDCHFHSQEIVNKDPSLEATILEPFLNKSLIYGLDIAIQLDDFEQRYTRFEKFDQVGLTIGLYPSHARDFETKLTELQSILEHNIHQEKPKIWALGECGMDFFWNYGTLAQQQELLVAHIELANQYHLPMVIHNRNASEQLIDLFTQFNPQFSGIIHCFSGTYHEAKRFLDLGFYLSFAGNLTFKKNKDLREVLSKIPHDKILFETDSPYLSPEPIRGKTNLPRNVTYGYHLAKDLLNLEEHELISIITQNFVQLFPHCKE